MNNEHIPHFSLDSTKWVWTNFKLQMAPPFSEYQVMLLQYPLKFFSLSET